MTEQQPLVSIVIPCYNHAQFVQETIQSVINQDYENIELIIIDDGSKDNSVEVIEKMKPACETRFKRFEFRHRPNKGLCATLNEALEWCEGIFISFIASDDIMRHYKTREQVEYLEENCNVTGVFGAVELLYKNGSRNEVVHKSNSYVFNDIFLHKHNLPAPTSMLRLNSIKNVNGFRENFIIEDWIMWLDLAQNNGTLDYLNRVFAAYRRHDGNLSGELDKMFEGRIQTVEVFKKHKLYRKAKAKIYLIQAIEVQYVHKVKSISYMLKGIYLNPLLLLSKAFFGYMVKFVVKRKNMFV